MRFLRFALLLLCASLGCAAAQRSAQAQSRGATDCAAAGGRRATVRSVDERLELSLDSGLHLRLAGVEPPRATAANPRLAMEARDALSSWLVGQEIEFAALSNAPDRWGRIEATATYAAPGGAPLSVAETVLEAGFARALPEPAVRACIQRLLAREGAARKAGLGLWNDPFYAIVPADDRKAFAGREGESLVAEGLVTGVGEAGSRLYINFGPIRTVDFTATIRKASLKVIESTQLQVKLLEGRRLRVRGLLDSKCGPQIEIAEPGAIEILEALSPPPYSRPQARR